VGSDFACERGFQRVASTCAALNLPAHAFLDYSGADWRCEDGFRRQGALCAVEK
jgi:hypothetical protein